MLRITATAMRQEDRTRRHRRMRLSSELLHCDGTPAPRRRPQTRPRPSRDPCLSRVKVATAEPTSNADALSGPTDSVRLVPRNAYTSRAGTAVHWPCDRRQPGRPYVCEALRYQGRGHRDTSDAITTKISPPRLDRRKPRDPGSRWNQPMAEPHDSTSCRGSTRFAGIHSMSGLPPRCRGEQRRRCRRRLRAPLRPALASAMIVRLISGWA